VRSPLFGISATLDAFDARYGREPSFRTYLDNLRREISRLNDLMGDLLELGKPATTARQPVRFGALIEESLGACRALAAEREVTLVPDLSEGAATAMVLVDRRRLLQVFENLFENAIHYSPVGASVSIRDDPDRTDGAELTVSILDEGAGFQPEDLPHLFEPFFTRRTGGTGLGLAIVRRILEDHGGSAVAENRPEGGAAVHVSLPLHFDNPETAA
jgi:signal transduction histidine kinase